MGNLTLVSLADSAYLGMLTNLIRSAVVYLPQADWNVTLVNLQEQDGDSLKALCPNLSYRLEQVPFENDMQKSTYCTNRRSWFLNEIRKSNPDPLCWIDADCLMRRPCQGLIDLAQEVDLSCRSRSNVIYGQKTRTGTPQGFMAGLILVGSSKAATGFLDAYDQAVDPLAWKEIKPIGKRLKDHRPNLGLWMLNQSKLWTVFERMNRRKELTFKALPETYLDVALEDDTAIWAGVLESKYSERFTQESGKV